MWNHSVLLLMLCNFCRHFVFLLVCRHLQSVTLGNWEVSPEVTGKCLHSVVPLGLHNACVHLSLRVLKNGKHPWLSTAFRLLSAAPHGLTDVELQCFIRSLPPSVAPLVLLAGRPGCDTAPPLWDLAILFNSISFEWWGSNGGDHIQRRITDDEAEASALIRTYGLSSSPGACWPILNGTPRKSRICRGMRCSTAVSFSLFLARPGFSTGLGTADWTAGQFRADCCPAGISLHVLPAWLVDTRKHTGGDLARRPASLCSLLVHLCPLAGFLVWIWWTGNKETDSLEWRVQV